MSTSTDPNGFIQYDGTYYRVIVDGCQVGLYTKKRVAEHELRYHLREFYRRQETQR